MERTSASSYQNNISGFIGKHYFYIYDNGWRYEVYIKNDRTIDYRIHDGIVKGRWVRDQTAIIVQLTEGLYSLSWDEPTGTVVSLVVNLNERRVHGVIFFPCWIKNDPQKTVCFQNDHIDLMRHYRDVGPTYPYFVVNEFATITFLEDCGVDNETVIACAPEALPAGYADRWN